MQQYSCSHCSSQLRRTPSVPMKHTCGNIRDRACAAGPLEQALGLLGTLMLRNPAAAELAVDSGCIDSCIDAMQACEQDDFTDSATGTQWVLRQVLFYP